MSRKGQKGSRKSNSKSRSKMDRYTEDLKYSLRRSLADSVDKVSLRTDDILARSHRQIVADFTDPRQWYYSATHDYIIGMLRAESQRQNGGPAAALGGGRRSVGSRNQESRLSQRSSTSIGPLSRASVRFAAGDNVTDKKMDGFIRIPTETSQDVEEIRRNGLVRNRDEVDRANTSMQQSKEGASRHQKVDRDNTQGLLMKTDVSGIVSDGGIFRSHGGLMDGTDDTPTLPSGKSASEGKQLAVDSLGKNTQINYGSFSREDGRLSDSENDGDFEKEHNGTRPGLARDKATVTENTVVGAHGITDTDEELVAENSTQAIKTYRESKQKSNLSPKRKVKSPPKGKTILTPLPGIREPFIPIETRNVRAEKAANDVNFPRVSQPSQFSPREFSPDHTLAPSAVRGNLFKGWKRRAGPKSTLDPMFGRKSDAKYVEDWVKKLEHKNLAQRPVLPNKMVDSVGRHDDTAVGDLSKGTHLKHPEESSQLQSLSLPNDFQPLATFKSFHPMTSLYIYSLKQKSDLKVRFNHFQIPRPLRHSSHVEAIDAENTFKHDLSEARTKIDSIEKRLVQLYEAERDLVKVVARKTPKTTQKPSGNVRDIAIEAKPISPIRPENGQGSCDYNGDGTQVDDLPLYNDQPQHRNFDSDVDEEADSLTRFDRLKPGAALSHGRSNSKVSVISLTVPDVESVLPATGQEPTCVETQVTPHHSADDFYSPSTSSWKQTPIPFERSKDVKVLEGKMVRVFDDRRQQVKNDSGRLLIRRNGSGNRYQLEDARESPEPSGLGISEVAQEVINDLLEQLDSPDDDTEQSVSIAVSESLSSPNCASNEPMKTPDANAFSTAEVSQKIPPASPIQRCLFCDVPH